MASPYSPPLVDFGALEHLPQSYQQGVEDAASRRLTQSFQQGFPRGPNGEPDFAAAVDIAARAGNPQMAVQLANIAQRNKMLADQRSLEQQRFGLEQQRYGLSERQTRLQEESQREKPQVVWQDDGSGNKVPYRVEPFGRGVTRIDVPGESGGPSNPFASGKMTEAQSKDAGYAGRMLNAERVLRDPSSVEAASSASERLKAAPPIPFVGQSGREAIGNYFASENFQKFDQAKRDFINAVLRRESGAAIAQSEFDNAEKQYFPRPGDSAEVIKQKKANRIEAIRGVASGAGSNWRPSYVFDAAGEMVPNTPAKKPAAPAGNIDKDQSIVNARAAIAAGKDRDAVIKKLRDNGIDPSGL